VIRYGILPQLPNVSIMQSCNSRFAALSGFPPFVRQRAIMQSCNHAIMQSCNHAIMQSCNHAMSIEPRAKSY